ncbi:MAG: hypothetical protein RSF40_04910 [Oscillospiraceae bacterium]
MASLAEDIKIAISKIIAPIVISNASIWERIADVFASVISIVRLEISNSENVISVTSRSIKVMGKQFYIDTALAFQYGDNLTIVDDKTMRYGYASVDVSKQIIKQVAISNPQNGLVSIKVATSDGSNVKKLNDTQLQSFTDYITAYTPIGIRIETYSTNPAVINCSALYVHYDNSYSLATIKSEMQTVLRSFQLQLRGFSPLFVNDIERKIQSINGVRDAYFNNISVMDASTSVPITPVDGVLDIPSGYFNFTSSIINLDKGLVIFKAV